MRKLITLALVSMAVLLAATPSFSWNFVSLSEWAASPITIGDKTYTLISTTWVGTTRFWYQNATPSVYDTNLDPYTDRSIYHETRSLVFKVTIVDDPATPENDALVYHITKVAGGCNCDVEEAQGPFMYTGIFDDNSDFSSPLFTFTHTGENLTISPELPGLVKELYVSLYWDMSQGYVGVYGASTEFLQAEAPVPTENTTWGNIKALYE